MLGENYSSMQNMSYPNTYHHASSNINDSDESSYAPLLGRRDQPPTPRHRWRRLRPSTIILMFLTGIGVIMLAIAGLIYDNNSDHERRHDLSPSSKARPLMQAVSPKNFGPTLGAPLYPWTDKLLAWQRTAYHFQPLKNWMNDPNGPVLYKGWYHLFYQYNPYGAVWGNIVWGHAASKDLINWRHLPFAMVPDQWYDANGVWTGSATLLEDGQLIILYTGATNESVQVQNLAYPADPSDPLLTKWVKYPNNPVLAPPPGISTWDFRDPTTAWLTPQGKWRFTIGSKINKTGLSLVYDTKDFKSYEQIYGVLHAVPGTGMWECVDFYPVSMTGKDGLDTSAIGSGVKHVVKTSLDDDRNDYYAIGSYNSEAASWIPDDPKIDVGIGLRYDYGHFYASKTFYDQDKKRRILWGWIIETMSEETNIRKGWASLQAIPREILFDKKTGLNLLQWPVEEVETLRKEKMVFDMVVNAGSVVQLDVGSTSQVDMIAEFEVDVEAMERISGTDKSYMSCTGAAERGPLGPFGLLVLADKGLTEKTPVYFYISKDKRGNFSTFFCADHSRSSEATEVDKAIYGNIVPVLKGEKLSMRILVDHSIVESFGQGGRTCITSRIYPTKAVNEDAKIFLFNNATHANITASLQIWQMSTSAFTQSPILHTLIILLLTLIF